jgi:hypothetical protein
VAESPTAGTLERRCLRSTCRSGKELSMSNSSMKPIRRGAARWAIGAGALMLGFATLAAIPAEAAGLRFSTRVMPIARSVPAGEPTAYEVDMSGTRLPASAVMTVTDLPTGASSKFLSTASRYRKILLVRTLSASPGSYNFTVTARSGSVIRSRVATLNIEASATPPPTSAPTTTVPVVPTAPTTAPSTTAPPTTAPPTTVPPVTSPPLPNVTLRATPLFGSVLASQEASFDITPDPLGVTITYYVAGAPADSRVDLIPNPSFGRMTMVVRTTPATTPGLYSITVSGVTPTGVKSVVVVLEVQSAAGLAASPNSQSITAGASTSYAISIVPQAVNALAFAFTVTGLPQGASALFSPASTSTATTLTVTTASATPVGTYVLYVTGTNGGINRSIPVQLVVSAPTGPLGFGVTVTPSTSGVARGTTIAYTLSISPQGGFSGSVAIQVTDLPAGASWSFQPDSAAANVSGRLTIAVPLTTAVGNYVFRVTATGGGLTATVDVGLLVS